MPVELEFDPHRSNTVIVNGSGVEDRAIWAALAEQHPDRPEMAALARWASGTQSRSGGLFDRDRYVTPTRIFDQMLTAQHAAEHDDVVSAVLESTESLAFSKIAFECDDEDQEDIWNQVADDIDLTNLFRAMWREMFIVSQCYGVTWWGTKDYKVSGRDPKTGNKRKKQFPRLRVPTAVSLMDPLRIVPVGNMMFNREQLVYLASRDESAIIANVLDNRSADQIISTIMQEEYLPDRQEMQLLGEMGVRVDRMWLLNPDVVWRHTATRPQYRRFADVRLKSIFEVLDLKHQLHEMDRATLLGATSFIVLVTKGTDTLPAMPNELRALQTSVRTLARVPVIVGDHRLKIEIITPPTDHTLEADRYNMLDGKLAARLYQTFITNSNASKDDSLKLARIVARGMESRRDAMKATIMKYVIKPMMERNDSLTEMPSLEFHPHQISLDFDSGLANYLLDLRDRGDISRQTILNQVDLDQDQEYRNRKREDENGYDDVFETQVPYSENVNLHDTPGGTPGNQKVATPAVNKGGGGASSSPRAAGRTQGGNRNGGGAAPGTGQGQPPRNPRRLSK